MPAVPWVRPSQGSVQAPAKGTASQGFRVRVAASATRAPTSQWPVWKPRAMGVPSAARRPPWVLRMRTSGPRSVRVPAHAGVLAQAEEIAGGLGEQHFGGDGENAGGAGGVGGDGAEGEVGGFENGREGYVLNDGCSCLS